MQSHNIPNAAGRDICEWKMLGFQKEAYQFEYIPFGSSWPITSENASTLRKKPDYSASGGVDFKWMEVDKISIPLTRVGEWSFSLLRWMKWCETKQLFPWLKLHAETYVEKINLYFYFTIKCWSLMFTKSRIVVYHHLKNSAEDCRLRFVKNFWRYNEAITYFYF